MRKHAFLPLWALLLSTGSVVAQSSIGIGTNSPNAKAALHVDAANADKGFMMPRLTTAQRNAMSAGMTASDIGLLVYDRDVKAIFSWNGTAWQNAGSLSLPFYDSSLVALNARAPFQIIKNSTGLDGSHLVYLKNMNPQFMGSAFMAETNSTVSPGSAIYGLQTGTGDVAGAFRISNTGSAVSALYGETNGSGSGVTGYAIGTGNSVRGVKTAGLSGNTILGLHQGSSGHAGLFQLTDVNNSSAAVRIETVGASQALEINSTGTAAAINVTKPAASTGQGIYIDHQGNSGPVAQFIRSNPNANGAAIIGYNNSNNSISPAVYGFHEGTGDAAIVGRINNVNNAFSAVYAETNGTGSSFFTNQLGTGRAAQIQITNAANAAIATRSFTSGTGKAGLFTISNAANTDTAFMAETNGTGVAIAAVQRGSAGAAGSFQITNAANNASAVRVSTVSNGIGIDVTSAGTAQGINITKPAGSSGQGIYIDHLGTSGPVAQFRRNNASGQGAAIIGYTNSNSSQSPAIYGNHDGTGDAAIVARINNAGNPWAAMYAETNGTGPSVYGWQSGTGRAMQAAINNAANTNIALISSTNGLGKAGLFVATSASNADTALYTANTGSGPAFAAVQRGTGIGAVFTNNNVNAGTALRVVNNSNTAGAYAVQVQQTGSSSDDALLVTKSGGNGSAGNFQNTNAANDLTTLFSMTNAPGGTALGGLNSANGYALSLFSGGARVSTTTISSGTSITNRSVGYLITGGGPAFTLGFILDDGGFFYFFNQTAGTITVNGISIAANTGKTCIILGGVLRAM